MTRILQDGDLLSGKQKKTTWTHPSYKHGKNKSGIKSSAPTIVTTPTSVAPIGGVAPPTGIGGSNIIQLVNLSENSLPGASRFFLTANSVAITTNFTIPAGAAGAGQLGTLNIRYGSNLAVPTNPTGADNIPDQFVIVNIPTGATLMNTGQVLIPMVNTIMPAVTGDQFTITVTPNNIGATGDRFFIIIWFLIP